MDRGVRVSRVATRAAQTSLFDAVRDGSWDVVQLKVRAPPPLRRPRRDDRRRVARHESGPESSRSRPFPSSLLHASHVAHLPHRPLPAPPAPSLAQLKTFATTTAITTAVAAVVSTALLVFAFALVVFVRFALVPGGPSSTSRELLFDFESPTPTAHVSFLSPKQLAALPATPDAITPAIMRRHRALDPGATFDVRVHLTLPESPHNRDYAGLFQVRAELLTARGDVLANATRPAGLRYASTEVRWLRLGLRWPLYALGLREETQTLTLPMHRGATERRDQPFAALRVAIAPRANASTKDAVPQVYKAHADIVLNMGLVAGFLYSYPASSFVLMLAATWGYLCAFALAAFAIVAALGLAPSPSAFAEEVIRRAAGMVKGDALGGDGGFGGGFAFPGGGVGGMTTSDSEESGSDFDGGGGSRRAGEESDGSAAKESDDERSVASELGGASTAGLRYRGAPTREGPGEND